MGMVGSFVVGILMLMLPQGWTETQPAQCQQVPVILGPPNTTSEECIATFANGGAELTVIVWKPVVPRDGGPMVPLEDYKGKLAGRDIMITRASSFMGREGEVLVTRAQFKKAGAYVLISATGTTVEDFQVLLDGISLAE